MIFFNKKRFDHNIEVHYNVLSEKERKNILKISNSKLYKISEDHPGLQTDSDFHHYIDQNTLNKFFKKVKNKNIYKCWVNYTDFTMKYEAFHNHENSKNTCVYMIENPEKKGTIFNINEKIYQIDLPTNSMIIFPTHLMHTVPYNITKPRYSLAINFI
jgi:hypothetical protein